VPWFKRLLGDADSAETPDQVAVESATVGGLNFLTAIQAHMKWKTRLDQYIAGTSSEDLKVEVVSRDDQCVLGKWLHGEGGTKYRHLPLFGDIMSNHANFHVCAGHVLKTARSGDKEGARGLLARGEYPRASEKVKNQLATLYVSIREQ